MKFAWPCVVKVNLQFSKKTWSPMENGKIDWLPPNVVGIKSLLANSKVTNSPLTVTKSTSYPLEFLIVTISKGLDISVEFLTILTDSTIPAELLKLWASNFIFGFSGTNNAGGLLYPLPPKITEISFILWISFIDTTDGELICGDRVGSVG